MAFPPIGRTSPTDGQPTAIQCLQNVPPPQPPQHTIANTVTAAVLSLTADGALIVGPPAIAATPSMVLAPVAESADPPAAPQRTATLVDGGAATTADVEVVADQDEEQAEYTCALQAMLRGRGGLQGPRALSAWASPSQAHAQYG